jgi:hypothetical protein
VLDWYIDRYRFHHSKAFVNFPPAVVHHLRLHDDAENSSAEKSSAEKRSNDDTVAA